MKNTSLRLRPRKVSLLLSTLAVVLLASAALRPSIETWTASSSEIDHSTHHRPSIEAQILALEKRDPHEIYLKQALKMELFLYGIADKQVVVPGIEPSELTPSIPVHVISRTGESGNGQLNERLDHIAREFAERYNREMYGFMVTWQY